MAIRDLKAVIYTDDTGQDWQTAIDASVFSQVGASTNRLVGGADYTGTPALQPLPKGLKQRGVYVANGTDRRFVVCLTQGADLYTGLETQVDLAVLGAGANTYDVIRAKRETDHRKFRNPNG